MATRRRAAMLTASDGDTLADLFRSGGERSVQSLPSGCTAHLLWAIHRSTGRPVLAVGDTPPTLDVLAEDLAALADEESDVGYFPAWESMPDTDRQPLPEVTGDRLAILRRFTDRSPAPITLAPVQALMQRTLDPDTLRTGTIHVRLGDEWEMDDLAERLTRIGYRFELQVGARGEACRRGGLVDLWPPTEPWPLRLEFFGPAIESIRAFDPATQRSAAPREDAVVLPSAEWTPEGSLPCRGSLFDYLPPGLAWIWMDPTSVRFHAEMYETSVLELAAEDRTLTFRRVLSLRASSNPAGILSIGTGDHQAAPDHQLDVSPLEGIPALPAGEAGPDRLDRERRRFLAELTAQANQGHAVRIYLSNQGIRDRFLESYAGDPAGLDPDDVRIGRLSEGFRIPGAGLAVVAESDLYGQRKTLRGRYDPHRRRPGAPRLAGEAIEAWTELQPGELVVHVDHGIGKYLGLYEMKFQGRKQEVLTVEYDQGARLQLPVGQAHLLTRYAGAGAAAPRLHRLGGRRWAKEKSAAEQSVRDLAAVMLETQAAREVREGFAFSADQAWQHEFEAAFPYEETPDQHQAIDDVKRDMERRRPMDRLVCGDVGYGKTEVAMRAAFKAVLDGKQVAVLVPTTILAQQHFDTFSERTAAFPFSIHMLSRFQTRGEQRRVVEGLATGAVDIVVGTHRLIQKDIHFRDLGLLIIDEEQRFGVEQKEYLKHMRQLVDVLTLTATPIPRTLYMSMMGTRDMSTIQSPPQERLPIQTHVGPTSPDLIRRAILREQNRGGQVYFLHNRVATIHRMKEKLAALVPEADIAVGHGQMHEHELAQVMREFVQGRHDVLLCTTIIESGVDIPNVNTIIVDRADRFGLSELYQLRGRVGRYKHQAYAYLLLPKGGRLMDPARQRIHALQKYGSLGAGFKLALKDLEIRGTGNLLGAEQSGHITAVGFELYCQFLKRTIAGLRGEDVPPLLNVEVKLDFLAYDPGAASANAAVIPGTYLPEEELRVHTYRRLSIVSSEQELDQLAIDIGDRFGPPPRPLRRLIDVSRLRILAARRRISHIETRGQKAMLTRDGDYLKSGARFPRLTAPDADGKLENLLQIVRQVR